MGKRITVDSATLLNKGFEVFEAHYLFDVPFEKIKILIHPQAIVHSLVELVDGSMLALLSLPDMRLPIQYALSYPLRLPSLLKPLKLENISRLEFYKPNLNLYPCLKLALEATKILGTLPAVINAADEVLVQSFLEDKIKFGMIPFILEKVISKHKVVKKPSLEDILLADNWAREETKRWLSQF
jgi:1-deoxy-D-xylulose-5-phosphate reductoisomerase